MTVHADNRDLDTTHTYEVQTWDSICGQWFSTECPELLPALELCKERQKTDQGSRLSRIVETITYEGTVY